MDPTIGDLSTFPTWTAEVYDATEPPPPKRGGDTSDRGQKRGTGKGGQ